MDTAQRRFDLERLFVPLTVLPLPPEFSETDPHREEKLAQWRKANSTPLPFGEVFIKSQRMALLALPGGGKTLLLKRLAVAYADTSRREKSSDLLPDLDLVPVLIRCREWREHIHRPITTILQNLHDITGEALLKGLSEALLPLFRKGKVLLLVDGLDEIHDDGLRATFVDHLEAFLNQYRRTRLVITSREAGFALVAPSLARFCQRWRIAPLEPAAIEALSGHWHKLMSGETPEAIEEAKQVAQYLLENSSLRRLAENPLLLTMLLVVKHGAGRLPPDRVSLYSRAAEVLLDTWNIKGHDPLNLKEAVPQLAYVAFQLMKAGKQTATERDLLTLLDEARERVPQIRRYAKDSSQEFLKRVELRSSLLVEAGRQVEKGGIVPFYQFRHLTFQEYLAAVAAVEGHYTDYKKGDNILTPLAEYLTAEEWKEVIPMSAVLARKQAEPLMSALVTEGARVRARLDSEGDLHDDDWRTPNRLPPPIARLAQCLVEEAEASPETLTVALQLVAFFGRQCRAPFDWRALCTGPYGEELRHQAWLLYEPMTWPPKMSLDDCISKLMFFSRPPAFWDSDESVELLTGLLTSTEVEEVGQGLLSCAGMLWNDTPEPFARAKRARRLPIDLVERHVLSGNIAISSAAAWAWAWIFESTDTLAPNPTPVLSHLVNLRLKDSHSGVKLNADIALLSHVSLKRGQWKLVLSPDQIDSLKREVASERTKNGPGIPIELMIVAFHARNVWPDPELAELFVKMLTMFQNVPPPYADYSESMLVQMGAPGEKALREIRRKAKTRPGG